MQRHWYAHSDWWLLIVTFLTGAVIAWQAWESRKAAQAAFLNAQAVVDAGRARILFEIEKTLDTEMKGVGVFAIYAVNYGTVPAQIIGFTEPTVFCEYSGHNLPSSPNYPSSNSPLKQWLKARDREVVVSDFSPRKPGNIYPLLTTAVPGHLSSEHVDLVIFGEITYRDGLSSDLRHSRYCFCHKRTPFSNIGGSLEYYGPSEYNECT